MGTITFHTKEATALQHDGKLSIATGRSRKETNWKNKEWDWSALVEKLKDTHRTHETHSEYMLAKKPRQDEIKDVGGFVGGYLTNGRRKPENVVHRQLITLDIDFAHADVWEDFVMVYNNAALLYSTHKHSPDSPRFRLILPIDRPVFSDEYVAISRKVAGILGIDYFDDTTFQPERLMYWPSTSKDGEYKFEYQDGPWLCADEILSSYYNWKDSSEWPVSSRVDKVLQRHILKQGDPLAKQGIVGAFCRTYSISEAIEMFLGEVYEPCDTDGRYTYKHGSTAGGLVVYEDKFAYSHHGTDPTSGKLCNAFDLVRLHKFGLKDEDAKEDTPTNRLPSYLDMSELAAQDAAVKKLIGQEHLQDAQMEFEVEIEPEEEANDDWLSELEADRKGNYFSTIDNIYRILQNDPVFKGRLAYDDFEKCEVALKDLPWRRITHLTRRLTDKDDANIRHYLESVYNISSALKIKDAMEVLSTKTSFHPVKDFLRSEKWDGVKRVDTLLIEYQGAEDTPYTRTVTRKALTAAVARIFQPGIKFDYVLTLVGKQGTKKSSLLYKLGGLWFSDSFSTLKGKEAFEQLQGVWLVEIAELAGFSKASVDSVKHFVAKREDRYRVAFGRRNENFPRQCIFFATTNKLDFLHDPTGDRRFWPVPIHVTPPTRNVFSDLTAHEIKQIWAEAVKMYEAGESIYLDEEMEQEALIMQKAHTEEHPWSGIISHYLETLLPDNWEKMDRFQRTAFLHGNDELQAPGTIERERVCVQELWVEALNQRNVIDERSVYIIRDIMRNIEGWSEDTKQKRFGMYGLQRRGYFKVKVGVTKSVTHV